MSSETLKVTLLGGEWTSSAGGLATLNRELAIHLSQHPKVEVSFLVPDGHCTEEDKGEAQSYGITVVGAKKRPGCEPLDWLSAPPRDHKMDVVVGHGVKLGKQVQFIKESVQFQNCKWVQVVHTAPEDLSKYKGYSDPISKGEKKHEVEVDLCKLADLVVPVGPRLEEFYSSYLQRCKRDVFSVIPGLFDREFGDLEQSPNENAEFRVLLCGRGDDEDFELKGYSIAVNAFTNHRLQRKPYHLIFVGAAEGKQEEVRERLLQRGITEEQLTVRKFVQTRERMKDLLCEVNLAIMPSRSEGFGLVALEALSAGLPILVSSKSGFARALENIPLGDSCVVNSDEPEKWAEAIEGVRVRHRIRLQEIKLLRTSYHERYSWKEQCENFVEKLWRMVHGCPNGSVKIPKADPPIHELSAAVSDVEKTVSGPSEEELSSELSLPTSGPNLDRLIRLIISAVDIDDEKKEELYVILAHNGQRYVKRHKLSGDVLEKGVEFFEYLTKTFKVNLEYVIKSSLEIVMYCPTLESLEQLWSDYISGHLIEVAERLLVTDEIKRKLKLETARFLTIIEKENYLMCKKVLMEMSGAAGSVHLPSEETEPDQVGETRGTAGTSSDDQQDKEKNTGWMTRGEMAKAPRNALHKASINGQYETVKILLESGADVDKRDQFSLTPLHLACWYGQQSVARLLLEHGANVNAVDRFQRTPLQKAERNNHQSIVQMLLENNASPSLQQPLTLKTLARKAFLRVDALSGFNLLQAAVLEGDYGTVSKASALLDDFVQSMNFEKTTNEATVFPGKSAADILSSVRRRQREKNDIRNLYQEMVDNERSLSELHCSAKKDDFENVTELVLNDGVDINIPAKNNLTPLMCASQSSSSELIKSLIDLGANINAQRMDDKVTPLLLAAGSNHYMATHLLLEYGADSDAQEFDRKSARLWFIDEKRGNTALHIAARGGFLNIARLLIESGCNFNQQNDNFEAPLHIAVENNSDAFVKLLLDNKADVNIQDDDENTALHTAVRAGFLNITRLLIKLECDINRQNYKRETPLHIAVEKNSEAVVNLLLENKADVNIQGDDGNTALHTAVLGGFLNITRLLIESGCDINRQNYNRETPLHIAVEKNSEAVVKLLLENKADVNIQGGDGNTALHTAVLGGFWNITRLLIESGCDINRQNYQRETPLHIAVQKNNESVVKLLVDNKADVNIQAYRGNTALYTAARGGFLNIARLLIESGCNINQWNISREAPLHIAVENYRVAVVKLLLHHKADLNIGDDHKNTALHTAVRRGFLHIPLTRLLIESGCDINRQNYKRETPLHIAVENNTEAVVKILLDNKADANIRGPGGNTALHTAVREGFFNVSQLLIKSGCNINMRNSENETPLSIAAGKNYRTLVNLLLERNDESDVQEAEAHAGLFKAFEMSRKVFSDKPGIAEGKKLASKMVKSLGLRTGTHRPTSLKKTGQSSTEEEEVQWVEWPESTEGKLRDTPPARDPRKQGESSTEEEEVQRVEWAN